MQFINYIHGPQRMSPTVFDDSLTFPLLHSWAEIAHRRCPSQIVNRLPWNWLSIFMIPGGRTPMISSEVSFRRAISHLFCCVFLGLCDMMIEKHHYFRDMYNYWLFVVSQITLSHSKCVIIWKLQPDQPCENKELVPKRASFGLKFKMCKEIWFSKNDINY